MKKIILFLALPCLVVQLYAQKTEEKIPPPPPPPVAPPTPVAPPPPEPDKAVFIAPKIVKDKDVKFRPPVIRADQPKFTPPLILNKKGYQLTVKHIKGADMVEIKSVKKTEWIRLSEWLKRNDVYEKKYGELPPPPPPPPLQKNEL